ncbi:WSC-domain-containing protein [Jaminaea rosea]|uniref:WSC-domain-containing protein n=1 Tax=Jaminaea rosea TaxID=1569628 RepID=A0A316USJ3_9BASI|nr:WSC-domain-containing protein [Jaminaea rosea]PWN26105.1 WSC-domain-containing protein [Jaminaea rosea]
MLSWTPLVVLALLALVPSAHAYWILGHHNLVSQRLDPIIAPNGISGHTHAFVGSAAIQPGQDVNTMCTTSPVKADLSKYWAPQLYYYNGDTRKFASINLGTVNTYYLNRGGPKMGEDSTSLQPFPKGLKMIAGSAMLFDAPNSDPIKAKAVSFVCLGGNNPQTTTLPTGVCSGGMRAQIVFPSCWNGKDLDSDDHQSHVAYPIGGQADTGDCPSTHPIKFMTLFYEFIYDTGSLQGSVTKGNSSSGFVLANGDAIGYSFHADFVSDWDTTVLKAAIDECDGELGGNIRQCAPFVPSIHEETTTPNSADPAAGYCRTGAAVNEVVLGSNFDALPGCQTVKNGPFKGAGAGCTASSPTTTATPNNSTPADAAYRGCYQEPTNARALVNKVSYKGQMSTSVCRAACSAAGFSVAGMEYGQECWCDNSMTSGAKKVSDDFCNMACPGNSTETCGGSSLLSVYSIKAVTTTAATSIPPTAGTSSYQGCYQELSGGRALSKASYSNSTNTPTQCAAFCASKGLQFSATQYSSECYCGASISTAKLADSQCSMLCSGDKTSFCGAASRLQVYKDNAWKQSQFTVMQQGQWNFTDCAVDSPSARTLPTGISNPANTVAGCLAGCQAKKMTFCGVEYGGECWGATKLPTGFKASNAEPVARGCSMPCNGNSTLYCGGSSRMNLYTFFSNASPTRPTVLA